MAIKQKKKHPRYRNKLSLQQKKKLSAIKGNVKLNKLKKDIYPDVKKILNDNKITTIMVSHNTSEVKNLSDRIFSLENGALIEL